ncbi:MAG: ribulose-phosphate 3-epimerase [Caldilineaceae bacterium]|nr:ribulose-phosphate 3-epimerase [Caldilineaceae bacterium]
MNTDGKAIKLAPSILTADFGRLAEAIRAADEGGADYIHLDVMDGMFVPNITFGPVLVKTVRAVTRLPLDVHLMVEAPERYLEVFAEAGADILTVHVEATKHLHRTLQQITALGCKAGIALNPSTAIEAAREVLPFVDQVLIMTVNPGFGAQQFIETMTGKVRRMRRLMDELCPLADLEVDGGIHPHNVLDVIYAGANVIVAGSAVFNEKGSVAANLDTLRERMLMDA